MDEIFIEEIDKIKDIIQDANLNFLIGSGLSVPFFKTLGGIEKWLTELEHSNEYDSAQKDFIKASLYKSYLENAIEENLEVMNFTSDDDKYVKKETLTSNEKLKNTYLSYLNFLSLINDIIYERKSNTVSKQVNLFTTNIDVFLEKAIEDLNLQYNDGFHGIFRKKFSLSNFKRSFFQKSLHYDNTSELPAFNLLKVHGSVNWRKNGEAIEFDDLQLVQQVIDSIGEVEFIDVEGINNEIKDKEQREANLDELCNNLPDDIPNCKTFVDKYEELQIVNPTKEKFKDTTFNKNYYEMLRLFSNELEKEASLLIVMGFSMADEHIREIIIRAIKSNPTLFVIICSFYKDGHDIISNFELDEFDVKKHRNVRLISLKENFDLKNVNTLLFEEIINKLNEVDKNGK